MARTYKRNDQRNGRKRDALRHVRSELYSAARLLGDLNALRDGSIARRLLRKHALRLVGRNVSRLLDD